MSVNVSVEFCDAATERYAAEQMEKWRAWAKGRKCKSKVVHQSVNVKDPVVTKCADCGMKLVRAKRHGRFITRCQAQENLECYRERRRRWNHGKPKR